MRNQVLGSFGDLIRVFSDIELFLATFPNDVNIQKASVSLTVTTLIAVERAIGFFIRNERKALCRVCGISVTGRLTRDHDI